MDHYVIFSALYAPSMGGVERYTQNLAEALVRAGRRVTVVTSQLSDGDLTATDEGGVRVVRLPSRPLIGGRLPLPRRNGEYRALMKQLADDGVDHVVINTRFYPHSLEGLRFAKRQGIVPLLIEHGSAHVSFGNSLLDALASTYEHGITKCIRRFNLRAFAVSQRSAQWIEHFGLHAEGVLSNSIDAAAFRAGASNRDFSAELGLPNDALVVASIGRFVPEKGVRFIIDAAHKLREGGSRAVFVVAGDGPLRSEVESAQGENFRYVGRLCPKDVSALLRNSDAFCLPSRSEGFATSLLECAAWGVPPIVTPVGGTDELVPTPAYGTILEEASGSSIAAAITLLEDDDEAVSAMGELSQLLVERDYSWGKTAARLIEVCEGVSLDGAIATFETR